VELQKDADNKLEPEPQWCPTNIFSRRQKRRAYRMRCQELMDKNRDAMMKVMNNHLFRRCGDPRCSLRSIGKRRLSIWS
jgi:hypothetical protein